MEILTLGVGILIGLWWHDFKVKALAVTKDVKAQITKEGKAEFYEAKTPQEQFKDAKTLDDLLDNK